MTPRPELREPVIGDAFGEGLLAVLEGVGAYHVVNERDDGFVDVDGMNYFSDVADDPHWEWIHARLGERVLDIGAGAGRAAVSLQQAGIDVTALDVSPGALEVCRRRGVAPTFHGSVTDLATHEPQERFDTFLCMGNNLGLLGTPPLAADFLAALTVLGTSDCAVVGTMLNPYETTNPDHLAYQEANRGRGNLPGQIWLRVRYRRLASPWFGLLWLAPKELAEVAAASGWELTAATEGVIYAAELRKREVSPSVVGPAARRAG